MKIMTLECLTENHSNQYSATLVAFLGFQLVLANNELVLETEELIYTWVTSVSNFGGALGLFVGFSFLSLYDWSVLALSIFKNINFKKSENKK